MIVEKLLRHPSLKPLANGQLWKVCEGHLKVTLVGKLLVHYKLGKPGAIRVSNSITSISTLQQYMRKNKAVLIQA